ncbi:MAG TPA: ABC transporter permease [Thermoanaerobaculia bacterium]|nr:ABC transporter permease [Thermoanaerobaculia bacterium]
MNPLRSLLRAIRRDTGVTVIAVLTLALALGATVTIFAVVNGILYRGLPFPEAERLIVLDHAAPGLDLDRMGCSIPLYLHYRERSQALAEVALFDESQGTITGAGDPERVGVSAVTPSFFGVLGVEPRLGRAFTEDEGRPGAPPVAILADPLWRTRYGGDPAVVGSAILVDGVARTVVGVMPPSFDFPSRDTLIWRPREIDPETARLGAFQNAALARLAPGATEEALAADLARLTSSLAEWFPEDRTAALLERAELRATTEPLLETIVGRLRPVLAVLLATVGIILLIACANVANLFLVRGEERSQELALRGALGATRGRLVGELIGESLAVAAVAGGLGLALARGLVPLVRRYGPETVPRLHQVAVDREVVLFALALALVSGLGFGLLPALRGTAGSLLAGLRDQTRNATASRERHRLRDALVAVQVALGVVLLVGSGLVVRSLLELRRVDPGFDPKGVLTFRISLPEATYAEGEDRARFVDRALERIRALPGVESAGAASYLPLAGVSDGSGFRLEDLPTSEEEPPPVFMRTHASAGYLETLGVELIDGRLLTDDDARLRTGNLVISGSIAHRYWPGQSALGKRMRTGASDEVPWWTVVGVVDDLRHERLDEEPRLMVHVPLLAPGEPGSREDARGAFSFAVRAAVEPTSLVPLLREALRELDREVPITQVRTLDEIVARSQAQIGFTVVLLLIASGLALVLATVGLYGVVSYLVARRGHEIGVRVALGAQRSEVVGLVLRSGLTVAAAGVAVGLALAALSTRWLDSLLYQVGRFDPVTFVAVPLLLLAVAAAASGIPAHRAAGIDPARALRDD